MDHFSPERAKPRVVGAICSHGADVFFVWDLVQQVLLDGTPLSLVTPAGVEAWIEGGIRHSYRYDQVRDLLDGKMKYRCLYEKDGEDVPFVLVGDPDSADGERVILFDRKPDAQT